LVQGWQATAATGHALIGAPGGAAGAGRVIPERWLAVHPPPLPDRTSRHAPARRRRRAAGATLAFIAAAAVGVAEPVAAQPAAAPTHGSGAAPPPAPDTAAPRFHVLVVNGADPTLPGYLLADAGLRDTVERRLPGRVTFFVESLDAQRFDGARARREVVDVVRRRYDGLRIDAVVAVTDPALDLVSAERSSLWPGVPVVHHSVDPAAARAAAAPGVVGVPLADPVDETAALAMRLQPDLTRLVVVTGTGAMDRTILARFDPQRTPRPALPIDVWQGLPVAELQARAARLPRDAAVLYLTTFRDAAGQVHTPRDVARGLATASAAPVYVLFDTMIGDGAVAGLVDPLRRRGERAGELLVAALTGETSAAAAAAAAAAAPLCLADARALARFGLDAGRLPADCNLLHRAPSAWQTHRWAILGAAAVIAAQSLTIGLLLWQRRRWRAAERTVATQRDGLSRLTRLAAAGELTASIAHEINQPLGAILNNADAAGLLLERPGDHRDELRAILEDIRRDDRRASAVIQRLRALLTRREIERVPVSLDAAVDAIAGVLRAEARRRGGRLEFALGAPEARVVGDAVQLQQVVLNLVVNALDATRAQAADADRTVTVATAAAGGQVELRVRDRGPGVPANDADRVFEPLYTTKADGTGLGLSIVRTIVAAHDGRVTVRPVPGGGAEFVCMLPAADMREAQASPGPPAAVQAPFAASLAIATAGPAVASDGATRVHADPRRSPT
jgi:signal transduction histidine kinase